MLDVGTDRDKVNPPDVAKVRATTPPSSPHEWAARDAIGSRGHRGEQLARGAVKVWTGAGRDQIGTSRMSGEVAIAPVEPSLPLLLLDKALALQSPMTDRHIARL